MTLNVAQASIRRHWACGSRLYLHPQPQRVIQFIGGFTFGSFPGLFYDRLAMQLCQQKGYSVVLHPFRFNPFNADHWSLALELYVRLRTLQLRDLPRLTNNDAFYLERHHHIWLGHSLGCKLIELLETLSLEPQQRRQALSEILSEEEVARIEKLIDGVVNTLQNISVDLAARRQSGNDRPAAEPNDPFAAELERQLARRTAGKPPQFILDQPSVLMAPQISGAVRLAGTGMSLYNARVLPTWEQTCYLVRSQKTIFNLTDLIRFSDDDIAADDILFLKQVLAERNRAADAAMIRNVDGGHLRPLCPTPELLDAIEASIEALSRAAAPAGA